MEGLQRNLAQLIITWLANAEQVVKVRSQRSRSQRDQMHFLWRRLNFDCVASRRTYFCCYRRTPNVAHKQRYYCLRAYLTCFNSLSLPLSLCVCVSLYRVPEILLACHDWRPISAISTGCRFVAQVVAGFAVYGGTIKKPDHFYRAAWNADAV